MPIRQIRHRYGYPWSILFFELKRKKKKADTAARTAPTRRGHGKPSTSPLVTLNSQRTRFVRAVDWIEFEYSRASASPRTTGVAHPRRRRRLSRLSLPALAEVAHRRLGSPCLCRRWPSSGLDPPLPPPPPPVARRQHDNSFPYTFPALLRWCSVLPHLLACCFDGAVMQACWLCVLVSPCMRGCYLCVRAC